VDNDEGLCELSDPPLSSVIPHTRRIGYEAAALLERFMAGARPPAATTFVAPLGVRTRRSTDVLAVEDRDVAAAVRFIRENACKGIKVEDVLAAVPLSRTVLERRFTKLLGRTPKAEIARVQLERVRQLLAETDFPLSRVATLAGFEHPEYLCAVFKKKTGQTPGRFRTLAQLRQPGPEPLPAF
jgi:LacI family transcriptional regulator